MKENLDKAAITSAIAALEALRNPLILLHMQDRVAEAELLAQQSAKLPS